jgi:hypothetical protein
MSLPLEAPYHDLVAARSSVVCGASPGIDAALAGLPAEQVSSLFDDVMRAYATMLKDSDLHPAPCIAVR